MKGPVPGTLYLCPTPIGNLADVSFRLLETLKSVDLIAAEDTRQTRKILNKFRIKKPLISYWRHNEKPRTGELISRLKQGQSIALTSDAGTPGISDPGYFLIREAAAAGAKIVPLPGPSAVLPALVASAMPAEEFVFLGFLPAARTDRIKKLRELASEKRTMIFYEAPHRLERTLVDLLETLGERPIASSRELTKKFETIERTTVPRLLAKIRKEKTKGELTLVLAGCGWQDLDRAAGPWQKTFDPQIELKEKNTGRNKDAAGTDVPEAALVLARELGPLWPASRIAALLSRVFGLSRRLSYKLVLSVKKSGLR